MLKRPMRHRDRTDFIRALGPPRIVLLIAAAALACGAFGCRADRGTKASEPLDSLIGGLFEADLAPGLAAAVVRGDEIVYARGFGLADREAGRPVTPRTLFYIASTTKAFTAFAAALLENEGAIDLESPVRAYLPELELQAPLAPDRISMRALLTHTHGIENGGPIVFRTAFSGVFTGPQLIALAAKHRPAPSGTAFAYGNLGYVLAGLAMERAVGLGWKDIVRTRVLRPAGMRSTVAGTSGVGRRRLAAPYAVEGPGFRRLRFMKSDANMHAAGGHLSDALDLARWLIVHINGGRLNGRQVFPAAVVAETHRRQADQDRDFAMIHRFGWGLGWDLGTLDGDTLIHRFGSFQGFRSHVSFMPDRRLGVVVLVNESSLGSSLCDVVAASLYDELLGKPGRDERLKASRLRLDELARIGRPAITNEKATRIASRPQVLPHPLAAYEGSFENEEYGRMEWRIAGGKLEVSMGLASSEAEVYDGRQNKLRVELTGGGETVSFLFEDGRATGLTYAGRTFARIEDRPSAGSGRSRGR